MKKILINLSILCLLAFVALPMIACAPQQETEIEAEADDLGEETEAAADEYGDEMEEMGEEIEEEIEEGLEEIEEEVTEEEPPPAE